MKTNLLIIIAIISVMVILAFTLKIKPYDDYPGNHAEELKQIPEVNMFYEKYGNYGISVFSDGAFNYQIGFQSGLSQDQWIMLKVTYQLGIPSNIFVHCTPNGIQSQYTIRDNVLEYLSEKNCFDIENEKIRDNETIQTIIDYCTYKLKLALGEISSKNSDGSYDPLLDNSIVFKNQTHYMDNDNCQLIQTWDGYSHSFGNEYEDKVILSINTLDVSP